MTVYRGMLVAVALAAAGLSGAADGAIGSAIHPFASRELRMLPAVGAGW